MPIIGTGSSRLDPRRPKYAENTLTGVVWGMMDYGYRPTCLVAADTDGAVHSALTANSDVFAFPDGFESSGATVGNQSTPVTNALEAQAIPAQWVQSQSTYLSVAHTVGAMFQFMQRLNGILGNVDPFVGATLNTRIDALSQATQTAINQAFTSFGWTAPAGNTTLRNALKQTADQWGATPLTMGSFTF
jgi:hypothetical protein